jgi:hypothetical protein
VGLLRAAAYPSPAPLHWRSAQALLILWRTIEDHDTLFVLAEVAHFVGIGLLAFKMYSKRSAAGG